ncbi:hypothetical protein HanPI659440_Chr02g0041801 [Helianthus annuus]|nr:hypothetical protein HanPI659440_Chr02g0041801 [Helianthus annuus]
MAEPSNPHSTSGENPEPSSPVAAEEEAEGHAPGENLQVLKWSRSSFEVLMRDIQMPQEYGAIYPQEDDTAGDAPTGLGVDAPLWRMFCPDFKGKDVVLACEDGEEGFNRTIRDNFRMPDQVVLKVVLQQGKETREEPVHLFATPPSSPKAADVEVQKEDRRSPSIEMVTPPPVRAEDTAKKPVVEIITDTLDSSNNLIDLHDAEGQWDEKPKSPVAEKLKSPVVEQPYGSTAAGTGVEDQPYIQPSETELEFYYRSYAVDRGLDYHHPPWTVMQGDDVSNDPLACRDILRGLGTPFEVLRARSLPRENRVNQLSSMLVGSSIIANAIMEYYNALGRREEETTGLRAEAEAMMKAAREGVERLKKDRAAFEKLKQTVGLKQVPDECKGWREACARENEKLFCVRQELTNLKAANAVLMKEKAAAEAAAKEAETRASKVLEEADADRTKLNKVEVQNRVTILEEVTACASEPEARVREAAEVRDGLITSLNRLKADRDWKRDHGIGHITTRY